MLIFTGSLLDLGSLETRCCCLATDLPGRLDTFEEAEEDDDPGQGQAAQDGESHLSQVPDVVGDVQNVAPGRDRCLLENQTAKAFQLNHSNVY